MPTAVSKSLPASKPQYVAPVPGNSKYLRSDQGIDWISPGNILSMADGQVTAITHGWHGGTGTGVYVTFDHPIVIFGRVYRQMYSAESRPLVKVGQRVKAGQPIASAGSVEVGFWPSPLIGGLGAGSKPNQQSLDFGYFTSLLGSPVPASGRAIGRTQIKGSAGVGDVIDTVIHDPGGAASDVGDAVTNLPNVPGQVSDAALGGLTGIGKDIMYVAVIGGGGLLMLTGFFMIGLDLGLAAFKTMSNVTPVKAVANVQKRRAAAADIAAHTPKIYTDREKAKNKGWEARGHPRYAKRDGMAAAKARIARLQQKRDAQGLKPGETPFDDV